MCKITPAYTPKKNVFNCNSPEVNECATVSSDSSFSSPLIYISLHLESMFRSLALVPILKNCWCPTVGRMYTYNAISWEPLHLKPMVSQPRNIGLVSILKSCLCPTSVILDSGCPIAVEAWTSLRFFLNWTEWSTSLVQETWGRQATDHAPSVKKEAIAVFHTRKSQLRSTSENRNHFSSWIQFFSCSSSHTVKKMSKGKKMYWHLSDPPRITTEHCNPSLSHHNKRWVESNSQIRNPNFHMKPSAKIIIQKATVDITVWHECLARKLPNLHAIKLDLTIV